MRGLLEIALLTLAFGAGIYTVHEFNAAVRNIGEQIAVGGRYAGHP